MQQKQILTEQIKNNLKSMQRDGIAITLDWLSLYFTHADILPDLGEGETINLSKDCYLVAIDQPTLHFQSCLKIIYNGQEGGTILYSSRNEKFFKKDVIKVDFSNHTLYSLEWQNIYYELEQYGFVYKSASRIDIAVDGVNYLYEILNIYAKQTHENKAMGLLNSSQHRGRFSAKILNTKTLKFENFNIGNGANYSGKNRASGSNKMITLYNKSLEIVKSQKTYIQDWWLQNGVVQAVDVIDLEKAEKELEHAELKDEVYHLHNQKNVYRFEIRLKSEAIKEIENFSIYDIKTASGLASIVRLHCEKYFEGYFFDDENVSRCERFDLLPYDRLKATELNKIPRVERDGLYKAKMTLHSVVYDFYIGKVDDNKESHYIEAVKDKCQEYNLYDYLFDKLDVWNTKYSKIVSEDRVSRVIRFRNDLGGWAISHINQNIEFIRKTNNQAGATANFGDD